MVKNSSCKKCHKNRPVIKLLIFLFDAEIFRLMRSLHLRHLNNYGKRLVYLVGLHALICYLYYVNIICQMINYTGSCGKGLQEWLKDFKH